MTDGKHLGGDLVIFRSRSDFEGRAGGDISDEDRMG